MALKKNEWYVICWADYNNDKESGPVEGTAFFRDKRTAERVRGDWEKHDLNAKVAGEYVVVKHTLPAGLSIDDFKDFLCVSGFWDDWDDDDWDDDFV